MQFFTQILLLACVTTGLASVAQSPNGMLNVIETRQMQCIKSNCGGVGAACAGAWCCVRYNSDGCKCIAPGDISENGESCPKA
ncbi:hypothetical protein COL154_003059 [Colletotrichum chrysophilum]|uniref:Uncharacterized protein n=1 Tax=Colletotrichum chrysophilum TaxID=1836956 RepID=A0AAD9AUF1_9PEZI|nr:uncharacterized protein COL26b_011216 [Colletotrichum chrysophilum]KAJ0346044.1 hypothetical protein KNSL1_007842 [Colletotrichum chrysophilum]KAJ0367613.1 hypothetical protein COL26b_011216 [Colletotrichum chrysophilum]KAJ0367836.1 hypothetical protein COL154_003059 [Colletotrichum chrysophilum]KAK1852925.1 hypothetical protein CCHR01_04466 [Colletotrichum chrysophilum]